jgi:hypothetical protein
VVSEDPEHGNKTGKMVFGIEALTGYSKPTKNADFYSYNF